MTDIEVKREVMRGSSRSTGTGSTWLAPTQQRIGWAAVGSGADTTLPRDSHRGRKHD